jgi:hypothetical protein
MKSILSLTDFYKIKLNAPMLNKRWSWGAIREDQTAVFLSIWQDEIKRDIPKDPSSFTWTDVMWTEEKWAEFTDSTLARNERSKHIELIKSGVPGFALVKVAKDVKAKPRAMKEFNSEYLIAIKNNFRMTESGVLQVQLGDKVLL